jgi:DNA-binding NtrC family response regulator
LDLFSKIRSMKLMLIDDDEWVRDSLRLFFESEGCQIVALETAEEGLNFSESCHFDIIIVDYRLPGMDGLEFIKRLSAVQADALKVLITAHGSEDLFSKAKQSGFHACIPKPFTIEIIEASLGRLIG